MAVDQVKGLDAEEIAAIRRALVIGLAAFGDLEERDSAADLAEASGRPWPAEALPKHPTGTSDVPSVFATALALLEYA